MKRENVTYTFIVLLVSCVLMITNGLLVALDNSPKIVSSFQANFTRVWDANTFWGRIVFGVPGLVEGGWAYFWLFLVVLLLIITLRAGIRPRTQKKLGPLMVALALLSIPIGGGFYVGAILGVMAGVYAMEFPKPFIETFVGRITSTLTGGTKVFESVSKDSKGLQTAVLVVILVGLLSGFGACLYSTNLGRIYPNGTPAQEDAVAASNILIGGVLYTDASFYTSVVGSMGVAVLKWLILSALVYLFGAKLLNSDVSFAVLSSVLAFVYVPEILMIAMPMMFTNEPYLSVTYQFLVFPISWPLILFYLSRFWAFVILVFAIEKVLDISRGRAVGTAILVSIPYFIVNYLQLYPMLETPGLRISFTSESSTMILLLGSIALLIAVFLGAFRKE